MKITLQQYDNVIEFGLTQGIVGLEEVTLGELLTLSSGGGIPRNTWLGKGEAVEATVLFYLNDFDAVLYCSVDHSILKSLFEVINSAVTTSIYSTKVVIDEDLARFIEIYC